MFSTRFLALFLLAGAGIVGVVSFEALQQQDLHHRHLFWTAIEYTPSPDPNVICPAFQAGAPQYQCTCASTADTSVDIQCIEKNATCQEGAFFCYVLTVTVGLNVDGAIEEITTCTTYSDVNTSAIEGTSTIAANYSDIRPCVTTVPQNVGDFSKLQSCTAQVDGRACNKCEICGDSGITMDCCNVNPNGEPLQVTCGPTGSGSFLPNFDLYQEGEEGTCSSAGTSWLQDIELILLFALAIAVPVSYFL